MGKLITVVFLIAGLVAGVVGYVMNIAKLFAMTNASEHIGELVIRIVGVFTGFVGAVAGYF